MELFDLIQTLVKAHGPSGDEGEIRALIARLAAPWADEVTADTLGNLIVRKKGPGPKVMFAAHMDSIGLIVTHIQEDGFLRVGRLGGVSPKEAAYTPVRFQNGARGVLVPEEKADFGKLKLDECFVDIGAKDREEARRLVQVGDTAVYNSPCFMSGDKVISPYMDNRVSCAILLAALERLRAPENDVYFVFTVQEEVGLRGGKTVAWALAPDCGVAVDVTDPDDTPGSERPGTVQLGRGAAVTVMNSSVICHPAVVAALEAAARGQNIPIQRDILRDGGTDAGAIHTAGAGVPTGGISVPCRYVHTPVECVDLADVRACAELTAAFAAKRLELKV